MPKALILEDIKPVAAQNFEAAGFEVETFPKSLPPEAIAEQLEGVDVLGIRSGPNIPAEIIEASAGLLAIGCFCVGTDQIDKVAAQESGIAIFNAPHENGRSVGEYVMGATYSLIRRLHEHNLALHNGEWTKTDKQSYEVRNKTLGIIGFGNIGSQAGQIAESNGMNVIFYDREDKPRLGNTRRGDSMEEVLETADVVTVHVPGGLRGPVIGREQLMTMKPGALLINSARAAAVDNLALLESIQSGHLAGAAIDVHKDEPKSTKEAFSSLFANERRVLLTPHIGGSTQEAQLEAARSVSAKLIDFVLTGSTASSINLPQINLQPVSDPGLSRISYIHRNQSGAMAELTDLIGDNKLNIVETHQKSAGELGYGVIDIEGEFSSDMLAAARRLPLEIKTRVIPKK